MDLRPNKGKLLPESEKATQKETNKPNKGKPKTPRNKKPSSAKSRSSKSRKPTNQKDKTKLAKHGEHYEAVISSVGGLVDPQKSKERSDACYASRELVSMSNLGQK
jgi:hypothetical protein